MSDLNMVSEGNSDVSTHESYSYHYSAHSVSQAENKSHVSDELHHAINVPPPAPKNTTSLKAIMIAYPTWWLVLAYLKLLMRVALLKEESENPHLITRTLLTMKNMFITNLFSQSLVQANTTSQELETVISTKDSKVISEHKVLCLTISWLSKFIRDTKHTMLEAINHPQASFGLCDIFGVTLKARLKVLLDHFLPPHSALLPIEQNGIVWFLCMKLAKALLWHIIFRVTRSNGVRVHSTPSVPLVMADLMPDMFKNAPSLLSHTLTFVESFCYTALVQLLKDIMEQLPNTTLMQAYPTPCEIHNQGIEMINMLLQLHDDPGLASLQTYMLHLCKLVLISSALSCIMADDGDQTLKSYKEANECFNMLRIRPIPACYPMFIVPSKDQLFRIGYDNNALAFWLQKYGSKVLSDSLFITTAVLFGLVDLHDLSGLLEVVFEEVKMQTPLQQEENCSAFLQQGGCCCMEQRMYHAQIEVSLFSKAIVNLCKELNTRSQPVSWYFGPNLTLLAVNAIGFSDLQKPRRRLTMTNVMPGFSQHLNLRDTMQVACNPSTPPNTFHHWESLLRNLFTFTYSSETAALKVLNIQHMHQIYEHIYKVVLTNSDGAQQYIIQSLS
ncbi:hypothetical protein BD769DRAFT_1383720 [Suillus cothurnatus]|nr:hypothetical protein BD769DRAFT_1383720 [Suillus cothurnatus]